MAITVKHTKVSTIPDGDDSSLIRPSDWNDNHQLSGVGTMAEQNANSVAITGGTMSGVTITGYIPSTEKGVANGVATLDSGGTIPLSQLPPLGDLNYQGAWNASTNTPTLTSSVGTKGYYYVVSVAGSTNLNGITDWKVSDWAVFNGSVWQKIDNTDAVTSVNGYTGAVNLTYTDVGAFPATSTTGSGNVVLATGATLNNPNIANYEAWTGASAPSYTEGLQWYDSTAHALAYYNDSANSIVHIGQDIQVKVINNTGSTIANGSPVYITSTSSGQTYPNVALAKADVAATSAVIGLTNGAIANGAIGYVTSTGGIDNVNTGSFTVGQVLYLSPYSAGQLMNTIPPTGITVQVGVVSYVNSSTGKIYVKQTTPLAVPASIITGTLGVANGGTGVQTITGYIKGSGTSAFTGSSTIPTTDLSGTITNAQLANSAITINGTSTSLGGSISVGTVTSVSATAPIASSGGNTPTISISQATTSTNGYLSSTDWNTFNGKGSGTVTSVAATVPSFLSVTGSPITSSGTLAISYSGTALPILNGGTGQTTANSAFNALAPSQTGNSGKYLTTNGTDTSWATLGNSYSRTSFTATASQTTFTVTYTVGLVQVYVNGVLLNGADYTATNGTSVVLAVGCNSGDIVEILAFSSFSVSSTVSSFSGGATGLTPNTATTGNVTLGGTLAVANGGTGVTTSTGSGNNVLSTSPTLVTPVLGTPTSVTLTNGTGLPLTTGVTGTLPIGNGGTGLTSVGTAGQVLITDGSTLSYGSSIVSATAKATTSGTSVAFTGIPSWVKRITVMLNGVSTSGTDNTIIQLGYGGTPTYVATGYNGSCSHIATSSAGSTQLSTGFKVVDTNANASVYSGNIYLCLQDASTNTWTENGTVGHSNDTTTYLSGGSVALSGTLTALRITTTNGTDTFDAGSINILYE